MIREKWFSWVVYAALALAFLAALVEMRARNELSLARQAGDTQTVIRHYFRALNWYVPFGSYQKAATELIELGDGLRAAGQERQARQAYERARSGLMAARHFYIPRRDLVSRAEEGIAPLLAREKLGPEATAQALEKQAAIYLEQLRAPLPPKTWAALMAVLGFAAWVGSALVLIVNFGQGRLRRRAMLPWTAIFVLGYAAWLIGLRLA